MQFLSNISSFTSPLHVLAEHAEWDKLTSQLQQLYILKQKQQQQQQISSSLSSSNNISPNSQENSNQIQSNKSNNSTSLLLKELQNGQGPHSWTPLMLSCARAPPHVIELILKCSPESANISDKSGTFPLHFVCSWWSNVHEYDDDDDGSIHLESSSIRSSSVPVLEEDDHHHQNARSTSRIDANISQQYEENFHKVLRMLLKVCPQALTYQNQWGMTPLHCIFERDDLPTVETLKILLGLSPDTSEGEKEKDEEEENNNYDGNRSNGNSTDAGAGAGTTVIRSFALSALSKPDSNYFLPLHVAASKGASEEILRLLLSLYPESSIMTTANGDLPIHLLQYWAENEAKGGGGGSSNVGEDGTKLNWSLFESGVFRPSKNNLFSSVTVGQVEALLEPICFGFATRESDDVEKKKIASGKLMLMGQNKEKNMTKSKDYKNDHSKEDEESEGEGVDEEGSYSQNAVNLASRLPGSQKHYLPIHIASEHGASFRILSALCERYPEGVATPQPVSASVFGSSSNASKRSSSTNDSVSKWPQEKYPIELFESGRAGIIAAKTLHMKKRHLSNPENQVMTNSTLVSSTMDMNLMLAELKTYDDRRDLLFVYCPDAVPSTYRQERSELRKHQAASFKPMPKERRRRKKPTELYCNQLDRINRLVERIRNEALLQSFDTFTTIARLAWLWMYETANSSEASFLHSNHQSMIGRIVTDMPQSALIKLSYYVHASGESKQGVLDTMRYIPCSIRGRSILDMAKDREPKMTMNEMLSINDKTSKTNWKSIVCEFLTGEDGLIFNSICRNTRGTGLRYLLSESTLLESGRTWNFAPCYEGDDSHVSEFWQYLDSALIIPECTHTVIVKYYLELSQCKSTSAFFGSEEQSSLDSTEGGLMVVCAKAKSHNDEHNLWEENIVASSQKRIINSQFRTRSGCEVSLSFRYNAGLSYSLRVNGTGSGCRVSVSNARVQQVRIVMSFFVHHYIHCSSSIFIGCLFI